MLETSYPNFEPSAGYMTESVQRAYISKGIEKNILPKEAHRMPEILSLVASNDLQKPIQFWQLFSVLGQNNICLLYTSPSPRDRSLSRMPSSA